MSRPKLLFLATEDWFVRSHFLPMVRRAAAEGFEPIVAARMGEAQHDLIAAGARVIDLVDARGVYGFAALIKAIARVRQVLLQERPALVHAIALRPILLAMLGSIGAPRMAQVLAVTGRGYLAVAPSWPARQALNIVAALLAERIRKGRAVLLAENRADADWVGGQRGLPEEGAVFAPGAGVELERYHVQPAPAAPPFRIGFVSRLVHSKGVDVLVVAHEQLRREGIDVTLSIAGMPDFENPAAVSEAELARWRQTPGVEVVGRISDVTGFWADKHIACLPSRGGEGLPRSLLEAGACGRAMVTTNVPGCADFVRDGVDGLIVPPDDVGALAGALRRLVQDAGLRQRMGEAARIRVEAAYTTEHATNSAAEAWRRAMAQQARN
ncbi:MAG: glycosyltransferase family 4 protein [Hyphomonadaceae bacterium]|nr:glycosyltransferase family 4 protein [Hyphomonadaceae bacterium]